MPCLLWWQNSNQGTLCFYPWVSITLSIFPSAWETYVTTTQKNSTLNLPPVSLPCAVTSLPTPRDLVVLFHSVAIRQHACGDGYSANQRGVSSIILFGSPSELGGWLTPTSHSVGKKSCCFDRQCCCCSGLSLVVVVSFAHSPPFDQRIILGRSGFSFTKPLQFLAHTTFLGLHLVFVFWVSLVSNSCIAAGEEPRSSVCTWNRNEHSIPIDYLIMRLNFPLVRDRTIPRVINVSFNT